MYIDPEVYKKEKIKNKEDKCWIDGYELAVEDIDTALGWYVRNLEDSELNTFKKIQSEIACDFVAYLKDWMEGCRLEMIATVLDGEEC